MNMKKLITLLLFICVTSTLSAQKYIVYAVTGNVVTVDKKMKSSVSVRQSFDPSVVLSIPEGGIIRLFDYDARKLYTLKNESTGCIASLIESQPQSGKFVTPQYFRYIMKNLRGDMVTNTCETDNATTIFRDANDSLFIEAPDSIK